MSQIDHKALEVVEEQLDHGEPLTLSQVGSVFGQEFWMLIVECLLDSQDAARAIQGAVNRLRGGSTNNIDDEVDFDDEEDA